jgi:hypothetical protein
VLKFDNGDVASREQAQLKVFLGSGKVGSELAAPSEEIEKWETAPGGWRMSPSGQGQEGDQGCMELVWQGWVLQLEGPLRWVAAPSKAQPKNLHS